MPHVETTDDLASWIADKIGIFGGCKSDGDTGCTYDKNEPFCCRQGFVSALQERMHEAVANDELLETETFNKILKKPPFEVFTNTTIGGWTFRERLRILFGRPLQIRLTNYVNREVRIVQTPKLHHWIDTIFKRKPKTYGLVSPADGQPKTPTDAS